MPYDDMPDLQPLRGCLRPAVVVVLGVVLVVALVVCSCTSHPPSCSGTAKAVQDDRGKVVAWQFEGTWSDGESWASKHLGGIPGAIGAILSAILTLPAAP